MAIKILLIEDDEMIIKMYKEAFDLHGIQAEIIRDGKTALSKLKDSQIDFNLIILDLMLPGIDGVNILKIIKNETSPIKKIPVFVLSNLGMPSVVKEVMKAGAEKFFLKVNFTPKQIIEEIKSYLALAT